MGKRVTHKRKRKPGAGRTKEQGVPAALAAVRHKTQIGAKTNTARKCKYCNRPAAYGTKVCRRHGAVLAAARKKQLVLSTNSIQNRHRTKAFETTIVPCELKTQPFWKKILAGEFGPAAYVAERAAYLFNNRKKDPQSWREFVREVQ